MDPTRSHRFLHAALALAAVAALLLSACTAAQSAVDRAVEATRTADKQAADTLSTALAGTLAAMPSATLAPPSSAEGTTAPEVATVGPSQVCTESMADLTLLSTGFLEGSRFLITLEKPNVPGSRFQAEAYTLLVNGSPFACSQVGGNQFRIYCTGRPVPPPGPAAVKLLSGDSSCTFDLPFGTIPVPPKPAPPPSGGGGYN